MRKYVLYHNPRWGKSRGAVLLLNEKNITFDVIEYLKNPLTKEEVLILAGKLGMHPGEFVRKKEKEFVENNLYRLLDKKSELAEAISKFPKIMERPILVSSDKAIIGRPPEKLLELISWTIVQNMFRTLKKCLQNIKKIGM